jgi:hypothetical protein
MTHNFTAADLAVKSLGPCRIDSPLLPLLERRERTFHNVDECDRVLFDDTLSGLSERNIPVDQLPAFEPAGPRRKIFFDPSKTRAAIVTCGGLCPGFNDVIRSLVLELYKSYGVHKVVSAMDTTALSQNTDGPYWTFRRQVWPASTSKAALFSAHRVANKTPKRSSTAWKP